MKQSALLMIDRLERSDAIVFSYTLIRPSNNPLGLPGTTTGSKDVDQAVLSRLCESMCHAVEDAIASPSEPGIAWTPLVDLGRALYETLMPDTERSKLRQHLRELDTSLLISTDQGEIPWELLFDSEWQDFLGLRLQIGRKLQAQQERVWPTPHPDKKWRCLIIADPAMNLDRSRLEAISVEKKLSESRVQCQTLTGAAATHERVISELVHPFDIIHYTGHVLYGELVLHDRSLSAVGIAPLIHGAPLIFLSGCKSAWIQGTTGALLRGAARAVVASMYETTSAGAETFADRFYAKALAGAPLGEALRYARESIRPDPATGECTPSSWGASWACMVLYADPAMKLEFGVDELQKALMKIGLSREVFDQDSAAILQRAWGFGGGAAQTGTPHLFAAMVAAGPNQFLWKRLQMLHLPPVHLEKAFREVFEKTSKQTSGVTGREFSENASALLRCAKECAKGALITELDLARGLARTGGGVTGSILHKLKVPLQRLDPDDADHIGPLKQAECEPATWEALLAAAALGAKDSKTIVRVNTAHIFMGLLAVEETGLAKSLRRFGWQPESLDLQTHDLGASSPRGAVECSPNAEKLLVMVQSDAQAAKRLVTPKDLIEHYSRGNGGAMGQMLESSALYPPLLTSTLFLPNGSLDLSLFDEFCQMFFADAVRFAGARGDRGLGRRHVIFAMLSAEQGWLRDWVREQNGDPLLLSDCIRSRLPAGGAVAGRVESAHFRVMHPELTRALCSAEASSRGTIDDRTLTLSLFAEGGGEAGGCLIQSGIRLPRE